MYPMNARSPMETHMSNRKPSRLHKQALLLRAGVLLPLIVASLAGHGWAADKAVAAATPQGTPQAVEDFESYPADTTFTSKQSMGSDGKGWASGWKTGGSYGLPKGTVADSPTMGSGKYLSGTVTTQAARDAASGAITRAFFASKISGPFTVSFRFRPDATPADVSYLIGDTKAASAFGPDSTSSWKIASINGTWQFFDGAANHGSNNYIDSEIPVTAGTVYDMAVTVDPGSHTWRATISGGGKSFTQEEINSRSSTFDMDIEGVTDSRWLAFAVKEVNPSETPTVGVTGSFSVDSISIRY